MALRGVSESLREEVRAPDLTDDILDRVSLHRTFLDARGRRMLWATRFAVAAAALLLAGTIVFVQVRYPQATGEPPRPTPLTTVVASAESEAANRLEALRLRLEPTDAETANAFNGVPLSIEAYDVEPTPPRIVMVRGSSGAHDSGPVAGLSIGEEPLLLVDRADVAMLDLHAASAVPSAIGEVHRWAMTASGPANVNLLGERLDDTPLLLQGSLIDEVRLPR